MRRWAASGAVVLFTAAAAFAAPRFPGMAGVPTLLQADGRRSEHATSWVRTPSQAQIDAAKPRGVASSGIAVMRCKIAAGGALGPCKAQGYAPTAAFGQAGLALSRAYAIEPPDALLARSEGLQVIFVIGWSGDSGCYPPYCIPGPHPPPPERRP